MKIYVNHVVHGNEGNWIENAPLPVLTSIQNGGSKLTPDATFWRDTHRVVAAKNKFDIWNRPDLRIKNIILYRLLLYHFCKKINREMIEYN